MDTPLLQTKFYIPQTRPTDLVARPRLIKYFNDGLHRKLTLVSAPAGFGKTTLIGTWLSNLGSEIIEQDQIQTPSVAWLSLDENDDNVARFFTYFVAAVRRIAPGQTGEMAWQMLQAAQMPTPEAVLTALINDLALYEQRVILVLDDYHLITEPVIHQALSFWLDNAPAHVHLMVTTRVDPPWPLALLRGRRQINEVRADDLRFTVEETAQFFQQVMQLELSLENATALETRTEGWIAGLQMAGLSMRGQPDMADFIEHFTGSHRYIFDYLADQVLDQCPPETRHFLLQTSILDRMCGPLCDAVIETENKRLDLETDQDQLPITNYQSPTPEPHSPSQEILEQLDAANLFITPLDDERRWYRYHHLFRDLLRHRLGRTFPKLEVELHRQAGRWFENHNFLTDAIEHALAAQDFEHAADLIETVAYDMVYQVEVLTVGRWVEALPQKLVLNRPRLTYSYAMVLSMTGRFEALGQYLQAAKQAALTQPENSENQKMLGQIAILKCAGAFIFGDFEQTLELVRQTQARYKIEQSWALVSMQGYSDLVWQGAVPAAETALSEAISLAEAQDSPMGVALCHAFNTNHYILRGQLHQACQAAEQSLKAAIRPDGSQLPTAAYPQALLGRLYYEWNQLDKALDYLLPAVNPLNSLTGFTADPVDIILALALLKQAQGDSAAAMAFVAQAEQHFQNLQLSTVFKDRLAAIKIRLHLRQAADGDSLVLQGLSLPAPDEVRRPITAFTDLTWARLHLAQHAFAQVDPVLARWHSWAQDRSLNGLVIETAMLQALSQQAQGTLDAARSYLQQALSLAASEGYTRLFLDEGKAMLDLLRQVARRGNTPPYVNHLLSTFEVELSPAILSDKAQPNLPSAPQPLIEPLTNREIELLQLLAAGLTNQEIATQLYIALSTVKRHNINIYGKLGVRNRTEAVAKARELQLL